MENVRVKSLKSIPQDEMMQEKEATNTSDNNVIVINHQETHHRHHQQPRKGKHTLKAPFLFAGITASILGSVFFSLSFLCLKLLPEHEGFTGKMKALFFRGFFISILCTITILLQQSTFIVKRDELLVNFLRCLFGTMAVFGSYSALIYIGMGDATALIFSSPIWTSILGYFILSEPLHCSQLLAVPISLLGIILIAHPALIINVENITLMNGGAEGKTLVGGGNSSGHYHAPGADQLIGADVALSGNDPELTGSINDSFDQRWPGIIIALGTSLLVSVNYIVLKFRKSTPVQTTTFWFGISITIFAFVVMLFSGFGELPSTYTEWSLYLGNGLFSWFGQSLFQWAFLYEEAGVLSIIRTLDVAMTFALSALFLTDDIYWTSVLGAAIIGLLVITIMLNNYIQQLSCMNKSNSQFKKNIAATQQHNNNCSNDKKQSIYTLTTKA